ncbi:FecR domain-containing protein, partial [bacterium]|nr:FecR domain-containing protein [bacterium]
MAEFSSKRGRVYISGPENQLIDIDRGLYQNSFVKVEAKSFALLKFKSGTQLKVGEHSVFKSIPLKRHDTIGLQLLKGQYFFNLPNLEQKLQKEFEIQTPMGIIDSMNADFLVHVDEQRGFLEVFCLDGKLNLRFRDLHIVLVAGESAFVENDKISRKLHINAAQSRRLFSWYRLERAWPIPPFLRSFSENLELEKVTLRDFVINGLTLDEINQNQRFGASDLVMGKLRFEGTIENRLPHQIIQISLDGGKNFSDVSYDRGFLVKRFPQEKQYNVRFRLRDFDKFYPVIQKDILFSYSERGNQQFVED